MAVKLTEHLEELKQEVIDFVLTNNIQNVYINMLYRHLKIIYF